MKIVEASNVDASSSLWVRERQGMERKTEKSETPIVEVCEPEGKARERGKQLPLNYHALRPSPPPWGTTKTSSPLSTNHS